MADEKAAPEAAYAAQRAEVAGLRQKAAQLGLRAVLGRSMAGPLVSELVEEVETRQKSGHLAKMWAIAVERATAAGLEGDEVTSGALGEILLEFARVTGRRLTELGARAEREAANLQGQAEGIERVLASLAAEATPPAE